MDQPGVHGASPRPSRAQIGCAWTGRLHWMGTAKASPPVVEASLLWQPSPQVARAGGGLPSSLPPSAGQLCRRTPKPWGTRGVQPAVEQRRLPWCRIDLRTGTERLKPAPLRCSPGHPSPTRAQAQGTPPRPLSKLQLQPPRGGFRSLRPPTKLQMRKLP